MRRPRITSVAAVAGVASLALAMAPLTVTAQAVPAAVVDPAIARSPELSETSRLSDRRYVVTGDHGWVLGTADGRYRLPASTRVAR